MAWLPLVLFATFMGLYFNTWFLLLVSENKSKLFEKKKAVNFPKVSILIPAHNEEETIGSTLSSVLKLDYPKNKMEVIVIDNNSSDNTSKIVRKFKNVKLIKEKKLGKANAMNAGMKHASGNIIGVLDADTIVSEDCLQQMVGNFDNLEVGAVTTLIKVDSKKGMLSKIQYLEYSVSAIRRKILSLIESFYITPGTLSLIRKNIAEGVGFSEDTFSEDMDMALSIHKKGFKIVNCMNAVTTTVIPKDIKSLTRQRTRWYMGHIQNMRKHSDILFNKKHFNLGCFLLPTDYLSILMGISLFGFLLFSIFQTTVIFAKTINYIPFADYIASALEFSIKPINFLRYPYFLLSFILIFTSSLIVLSSSLKLTNNATRKNLITLPVYMYAYYMMIMVYWILSFLMEITRFKRKW